MRVFKIKKKRGGISGQTAIELAVFGSILVFVVGSIIKQHMSFAYTQNQYLKAFRWAMTTSYLNTMGLVTPRGDDSAGTSSRNQATTLIVEDRLQVGSDKYQPIDRVPYVSTATATFSRNLFLGLETGEWYNLPVMDIFVNGKHFVLRLAGFETYNTAVYDGDPQAIPCGSYQQCTSWSDDGNGNLTCDAGAYTTVNVGCRAFFKKVPNHEAMEDWCVGTDAACGNLPQDYRFDLDRSGTGWSAASYSTSGGGTFLGEVGAPDPDVPAPHPGALGRGSFSWQWVAVPAFDEDKSTGIGLSTSFNNTYGKGISLENSENQMVDVDNDLYEERVLALSSDANGIITSVTVMDMQSGDYDVTENTTTKGARKGFTNDLQLYTFVKSGQGDTGTYLLLEQGKLYNPANGQYIRSVQKKDQVDIVQRILQLSHDTGRFCDANNNVVGKGTSAGWTDDVPNPVEACGDCFMQNHVGLTCYDKRNLAGEDGRPVIYVRSRIADLHGRKWITPIEDDFSTGHYVDFSVPSTP